jgi:hypothetical protein
VPDVEGGGGVNVLADTGTVILTGFTSSFADLAALVVAGEADMEASVGEVSHSAIGANVQVAGFDLDRIRDRVDYRDNVLNLDVSALPVPGPAEL